MIKRKREDSERDVLDDIVAMLKPALLTTPGLGIRFFCGFCMAFLRYREKGGDKDREGEREGRKEEVSYRQKDYYFFYN